MYPKFVNVKAKTKLMIKRFLIFTLVCLNSYLMYAQTLNINGTILSSDNNQPLPGVSVIIKGTTIGTSSNIDGEFSIKAELGNTLVLSFIGYTTQEIPIINNKPLSITLQLDSKQLEEVVVVGYGTVKKSDLTGSVATVTSEKIQKAQTTGIDQAIQGKVAGVSVTANTGQPGSSVTVRIRGVGTVGNSDPLYVVDGVALSNINFLNPSDIKSMEILKDASATAIYGSRGANGVVMITTNSGKTQSRMNSTFSYYTGIQNKWKTLDMMNREQYAKFKGYDPNDATYTSFSDWVYKKFGLSTNPYIPTNINYENYDTDWQEVVFNDNARISNYHFTTDGGSETSTYSLSLGYLDQEGIIISSKYKRITFRVNTSHQLNKVIKVGENLSFYNSKNRGVATNNENYSVLNSAIAFAPWDPVKYPDGRITPSSTTNLINPISMIENQHPEQEWNRAVGNVYADFTPIKGLTFKSDYGIDISYGKFRNFKPKYFISTNDYMENNFLVFSDEKYFTWQWENTLTYNKIFQQKHDLTLMVGTTAQESRGEYLGASGTNIPNESPNLWYLNNTTKNPTVGSSASESSMLSYFGRVQYSYSSKYLFTFNIRRDGSSRFGKSNRWGIFPSFALGWNVHKEDFFSDFNTSINSLKLRIGWGRIGNQEIGNYAYTPSILASNATFVGYVFGNPQALVTGGAPLTIPNEDIKWETTEQLNIGTDLTLLDNKLAITIEYYIKDTKDMLVDVPLPGNVGVVFYPTANAGKVRNSGFEFSADYKQKIGEFDFSLGANLATIKNEVISLGGGEDIYKAPFFGENLTRTRVGDPIGSFYGYQIDGIFQDNYDVEEYINSTGQQIQSDAQPGDYRFVNQNDDNKIDDKDKVNLGSPIPSMTYGFNASLAYKGFDIQIFFQGVYGNKIFNCNKYFTEGTGQFNLDTKMLNAWSGKGTSNTLANPGGSAMNLKASSRYIEDGAYLRLKNLQIGYTIPKLLSERVGLYEARIYIAATNLLTFTKYSGFDPEIGITNGLDMGVDRGTYPQARTLTMGVTLKF